MPDEIRCDICGLLISDDEFEADLAFVTSFTPDSELGPEETEYAHVSCVKREDLKLMADELMKRSNYSLEIGPGWIPLVSKLIDDIDAIGVPYVIQQIKEKFGGLRFYWMVEEYDEQQKELYDEVQRLIDEADRASFTICEVCGEPGRLCGEGFVSTLCEKHERT